MDTFKIEPLGETLKYLELTKMINIHSKSVR